MKTLTTMAELQNDLLETYTQITPGSDNLAAIREKSYLAGKIIQSYSVRLKYAQLRKETPNIPFLFDLLKSLLCACHSMFCGII